jgi:hypothetical protein
MAVRQTFKRSRKETFQFKFAKPAKRVLTSVPFFGKEKRYSGAFSIGAIGEIS